MICVFYDQECDGCMSCDIIECIEEEEDDYESIFIGDSDIPINERYE